MGWQPFLLVTDFTDIHLRGPEAAAVVAMMPASGPTWWHRYRTYAMEGWTSLLWSELAA
jgi:hypothetical protein